MKKVSLFILKAVGVIFAVAMIFLTILFNLMHPYGINQLWNCNGPAVLMGVNKFEVLGKSFEEIDDKYLYNEELLEYDNDGNVTGCYYYPTEGCLRACTFDGLLDVPNMYVCVTFENGVAVKMKKVNAHKDSFEFFKREMDEPFDDWFTSYPYLGFIY